MNKNSQIKISNKIQLFLWRQDNKRVNPHENQTWCFLHGIFNKNKDIPFSVSLIQLKGTLCLFLCRPILFNRHQIDNSYAFNKCLLSNYCTYYYVQTELLGFRT